MAARLLYCAAAVSALAVLAILAFLVYFSLPLFQGDQLAALFSWHWRPLQNEFGILPMIAASLALAVSSMLVAYPLALGVCCFAHGLGPDWAARPLLVAVRLMSSVPTVVYGLVAAFSLVPLIRGASSGSGLCWLAALLTLAVLALPTIVLLLDNQFQRLESEIRLTAAALGLTRVQEMLQLTLPLSSRGLVMAAILGFGRALGDTLVPLMLAGNAPQPPLSLLDPMRTLTAHIALVVATDSQSAAYNSLFACGLILFLLTVLVNLGLRRIRTGATAHG
ncbi:MAG: ABC-type transporter, integral rane subunit [Proteobacteria bacterium]|nr:ABC-type transporter, integral rane subunit [Pseudomonadota bacterium]